MSKGSNITRAPYFRCFSNFLLFAPRFERSRPGRIPARCKSDPAASFNSSSNSGLDSRRARLTGTGHLTLSGWRTGSEGGRELLSSSESSSLWKPSLPARRPWLESQAVSSREDSEEDEEEDRDEQRWKEELL